MTETTLKNSTETNSQDKKGHWVKDTIGVLYVVDGQVQFADDFDHLANGFCRLLEISEMQIMQLIEEWVIHTLIEQAGKLPSQLPPEQRLKSLQQAVLNVFPPDSKRFTKLDSQDWGKDFLGHSADTVYAGSISGNLSRAVVGSSKSGFAWLINPREASVIDARSIEYDTAYFNDRPDSHYGMKQYLQHTDWRMNKARRFANHMLKVAGIKGQTWLANPSQVSLLDIGSATGLFRAAVAELGLQHYGIDVSPDAIGHCREGFGFDTWQGSIFDVAKYAGPGQKFDIITFWDVIEHLDSHLEALKSIMPFLSDEGIIVVRTPNLEAIEATILGDMYYSYKLDHTSYFSPRSLNQMFKLIGMQPTHVETVSHIFKGLLGVQYLYEVGQRLEGADILALYSRAGSNG